MGEFTRIMKSLEQGDQSARERLLPLVYDELRRLAAAQLASERPGQTLQPTALVHEAYLRLFGSENPEPLSYLTPSTKPTLHFQTRFNGP